MKRRKVPLVRRILDPYLELMLDEVVALGGAKNSHAHLCRADTIRTKYLDHIGLNPLDAASMPLLVKQNLTGDLHRGPAYTDEEDFLARVSGVLERLIAYSTATVSTCVDVCPGIPKDGLLAWEKMRQLQEMFAGRIKILLAPSPIFGFKEGTGRWEVYCEAAKTANYLSALPEKDDFIDRAARDGKIGFVQHIRRVLELGCKLEKEIHLHLDQADDPNEEGTITLVKVIDSLEQSQIDYLTASGRPKVWAVHMISPSAYPEEKFKRLLEDLKRLNIGVIICPSAAISMRRLRPIVAPMHNSVARFLDLVKRKIPMEFGSDNICDVFVPSSSGDMLAEVGYMGTNVFRFYPVTVLAKLLAGVPLNAVDIDTVGRGIYQDCKAFTSIDPLWQSATA